MVNSCQRGENFPSHIVFRSDLRLGASNPILEQIAKRITPPVSENMKENTAFEPTAIIIGLSFERGASSGQKI